MKRPNFLIISADQHRGDCLGVEGRRVSTPNLDQLAHDGVRFTSAICPAPVCQPARASILTGQLCRTHGVHDNGIDLDEKTGEAGFAGTLSQAGYDTGIFGKAHFSSYDAIEPTGRPEAAISSVDFGPDWNGPYMGFNNVELMLSGPSNHPPQEPPVGYTMNGFSTRTVKEKHVRMNIWQMLATPKTRLRHGIRNCRQIGTIRLGQLIARLNGCAMGETKPNLFVPGSVL